MENKCLSNERIGKCTVQQRGQEGNKIKADGKRKIKNENTRNKRREGASELKLSGLTAFGINL
jgi:hypothetical protein